MAKVKIKQPSVGNPPKLSIARTRQIADSLEKDSYATLGAARKLKESAKTDIQKKSAEYLGILGDKDLRNSERYRKLADEAVKKSIKK
jgi:hypothetical protein